MVERTLRIVGEENESYGDSSDIKKLLFLMQDPEISKGIFRQLEVLTDVRRKEVDALYNSNTLRLIESPGENIIDIRKHQILQASQDTSNSLFIRFQKAIDKVEWYRTMLLLDFKTKIEPVIGTILEEVE